MKILMRSLMPLIFVLALAGFASAGTPAGQTPPLKGYSIVIPWKGGAAKDALAASFRAATIPMTSFTFKASKDGTQYTDVIVGQSPFAAGLTATHVKVLVVPMVVHIGSHVFDHC